MKFSIITPSYNQVQFIEETILSVLNQNVDLEYCVIDGGSTDGTPEVLERYAKKYPNFFYISEPDQGQSSAINKGIKKTQGDIVAYLNSDDVYLPGALEKVKTMIQKHPEVRWFYGRSIIVDEKGRSIKPAFTRVKNFLGKRFAYWKLLSFNIISQPAVFLRREVFDQFGYFNEIHHLAMDYEFWVRIAMEAPPLPILENLSQFRVHTTSKTSSNIVKIYWDELMVSLGYLRFRYWYCAFIHLLTFIIVVIWMRFKRI